MSRLSKIGKRTPEYSSVEIFPSSARMTEERWKEIQSADKLHRRESEGHSIATERDIVSRFPAKREYCNCGWRGEWYRIRSTNLA